MTESVAYMSESGVLFKEMPPNPMFELTPLYKLRELTDAEIDEVWAETCSDFKLIENGKTKGIINIYDVSRALLQKAREK
jgi:hypothetical protein